MKLAHRFAGGGKPPSLGRIDPRGDRDLDQDRGVARTEELAAELDQLDDLLFAASRHALLVVLQGRDAAGKDGLIRHLLAHLNVQSARVVSFKAPSETELGHDFLWRVHRETPARGEVVFFNRSHYEDVLVVRVHGLVPEAVWRRRYDHIVAFERGLVDAGVILLKLFLHIGKEEQEARLLAREQESEKAWKLAVRDWQERERWDDYSAAYEEAIARTATPEAPWIVVPSDRKWYRNLVVTEALVEALRPHRRGWLEYLERLGRERRAELAAYRKERGGKGRPKTSPKTRR